MDDTTGLRERKKAETRTAISRAVMRLALEHGLDAVNADDIAAAANVSVRTFHNYFGNKQEALVAAWHSEFEVHVTALRSDPRTSPSSCPSSTSSAGSPPASPTSPTPRRPRSTSCGPASRSPGSRSVLLDEEIRMVIGVVAARTGTDPEIDIYPHMVTAAAIAAIVTSFQFAPQAESRSKWMRDRLLHECFDLLRAGLVRIEGVRMQR